MSLEAKIVLALLLVGIATAALIVRAVKRGPWQPRLERLDAGRNPEGSAWFQGTLVALGVVLLLGVLSDLDGKVRAAEAERDRRVTTEDCPPPRTDLSETVVLTARLAADGKPAGVSCYRARSRG